MPQSQYVPRRDLPDIVTQNDERQLGNGKSVPHNDFHDIKRETVFGGRTFDRLPRGSLSQHTCEACCQPLPDRKTP